MCLAPWKVSSQQIKLKLAGQRMPEEYGGGRKPWYYSWGGRMYHLTKAYKSTISEIAEQTFNTGQNKYTEQFTQSCKEVANYLQWTLAEEGYLVAEMVRTRKEQTIPLPPPVDANAPDKEDLIIIRAENVKTISKRWQKLQGSLKKGHVTVYGQCLHEVRDMLKSTKNWETTQKDKLLHGLISKIEKI